MIVHDSLETCIYQQSVWTSSFLAVYQLMKGYSYVWA